MTKNNYLDEVQGLRTVAALLVAVYHIWFDKISGAVDIFFVVSAFFISLKMVQQDKISIWQYYSNTLRRVLPVSMIVILATLVAVKIFLPLSRFSEEIKHALFSVAFFENWYLAFVGTDYLSLDEAKSPFQQFWALSLQMQLYFAVPLLIVFIRVFAHGRFQFQKLVSLMFLLIFGASLSYSTYRLSVNPAFTYFDTFARLWEFSVGILLIIIFNYRLRVSHRILYLLGLSAFSALAFAPLILDYSNKMPGIVTLVPVLSAAIIIWVSNEGVRLPILSNSLVMKLGNYSFAFYLWHWPILVLYKETSDIILISFLEGTLIILVSAALAYFSTRLFEMPLRRVSSVKARTIGVTIYLLVPAAITLSCYLYVKNHKYQELNKLPSFESIYNMQFQFNELTPKPFIAKLDLPEEYENGCHQGLLKAAVKTCAYNVKQGQPVIHIVGGSHSTQWVPLFKLFAREFQYSLLFSTKSACPLSDSYENLEIPSNKSSCEQWKTSLVQKLIDTKPDIVFMTGTRGTVDGEVVPQGYYSMFEKLQKNEMKLLTFRDNYKFNYDPSLCVEKEYPAYDKCEGERKYFHTNPSITESSSLQFLDIADELCDDTVCFVVKEKILVYRDTNHLTNTFVLSLYPKIKGRLLEKVNSLSQ